MDTLEERVLHTLSTEDRPSDIEFLDLIEDLWNEITSLRKKVKEAEQSHLHQK